MGCGASKESQKEKTVIDNIPNTGVLKSAPNSFVQKNPKSFPEVYKVGKVLGSGSFGEVRSVVHRVTNQERAVKIFRKNVENAQSLSKIRTEIEILKKISHPIIVQLFEYFEDEKRIYLVMEKCSGGELFDEIAKRKVLSESIAAVICKQLFSVVGYLHENRIMHRDIKPENILLEEKDEFINIKIIDFGAASMFIPGTNLKDMVGSAFYLAPEVVRYNYNEKCDTWSCGVILYILLCGVPPFPGNSNENIIANIKKGEFSMAGPIWENTSHSAKDLISKLLCPVKNRLSAQEALLHPWTQQQGLYPTINQNLYVSAIENLKTFNSLNKFRDSISTFISSQVITSQVTKDIRELFKVLDTNGDGKLSKEEMIEGFTKAADIENVEEYIDKVMNEVDTDGNGFIDYNEFLKASIHESVIFSKANMRKAFDMLDLDRSGKISSTELQQIFSIGNLNNKLWKDIIKQADKNSDGEIDFEEFSEFLLTLSRAKA